MKRIVAYVAVFCFLLIYLSCKKQFNADLRETYTNYLTVEGPIISGDSTFITLSRTTGLKDTTRYKAELKAIITIESDQNAIYPLVEKGKGKYALGITTFDVARKYRLNIKTANGATYQSDFVPIRQTPPIDSLYYKQSSSSELTLLADAHDGANKTRYYRWDYKETWAYTSYYGGARNSVPYLRYVNVNGNIIDQYPSGLFVGTCYASENSNEILVGSSAKIVNDVITGQQLTHLKDFSQKIMKIYNMQLHQYAITEDAFNYYQNLKKNTEQLGSIFDSQASITTGNIRCISNPAERVIGYVSASTVSTKLLTIPYANNPLRNDTIRPGDCTLKPNSTCLNNFVYYVGGPSPEECNDGFSGQILLEPASNFTQRVNNLYATSRFPLMITSEYYGFVNGVRKFLGYNYYQRNCIDCRTMVGGAVSATLVKPPFFPDIN